MTTKTVGTEKPPFRAIHYREKARKLREMADSVQTDHLRDQFLILASQFDQLAANAESGEPWR